MAQSETFKFTVNDELTALLDHPDDSSTVSYTSDKLKGDGYYGRSDGFHTVQYSLNGFNGTVSVQATLSISPAEADWFTIYEESHAIPGSDSSVTDPTESHITNFTGNYVWIRASVEWTDGTLLSIKINH